MNLANSSAWAALWSRGVSSRWDMEVHAHLLQQL